MGTLLAKKAEQDIWTSVHTHSDICLPVTKPSPLNLALTTHILTTLMTSSLLDPQHCKDNLLVNLLKQFVELRIAKNLTTAPSTTNTFPIGVLPLHSSTGDGLLGLLMTAVFKDSETISTLPFSSNTNPLVPGAYGKLLTT